MAKIDPEQERQRLIEFYSQQMDGELEKVASQAYELTDIAREALRAEIARRGLSTEFVELAPVIARPVPPVMPGDPLPSKPLPVEDTSRDGALELRELVTIRKFRDLPEALLAKGCLESAGIEAVLGDDNMVRMDWFISNFVGGVKLLVKPEDAAEAQEILDQPIPEELEVTGIGDYRQPRCPKCESLDVAFQELNKPIAYGSAWVGLPLPVHRRAWRCHSCRAEWEDDDAASSQPGSSA